MNYLLISFLFSSQIRAKGYKAIQCLEKDLSSLYQIQLKYLDKLLLKPSSNKANLSQNISTSNQSKHLDKLVNQSPIGVFKKSELGCPMRLYYYLSPLDVINYHQKHDIKSSSPNSLANGNISNGAKTNGVTSGDGFDVTYKILSSLTVEQLIQHELGAYVTVSLVGSSRPLNTSSKNETSKVDSPFYKLADCPLLLLNENDDERSWHDSLNSYFNTSFNFEKYVAYFRFQMFS